MEAIKAAVLTRDRDYGLALCRAIAQNRRNFLVTDIGGEADYKGAEGADFLLTDFSEEEVREGKDAPGAEGRAKAAAAGDEAAAALAGCSKAAEAGFARAAEGDGRSGSGQGPAAEAVPVFLCERESAAGRVGVERPPIAGFPGAAGGAPLYFYKYGNVKELCDMLLSVYCLRHGRSFRRSADTNCLLISVTSDKGGCGKTCFALALAQELRRFRGKRVLYISFSPFESTESYLPCPEEKKRAFQELLYYFFKGREVSFEGRLLSDSYGVEILPPALGKNPLADLESGQLESFLDYICGAGLYDAVICDMAGSFTETEQCVLELSGKICLISPSERLKEYLTVALGSDEKLAEPRLCRDPESVAERDGRLFISIDSDYGDDVKKFAENFIY